MTFDDLANVALIGTTRAPASPPAASDDALGRTLAVAAAGSPEDFVLGAAAALAAYEACGATPATDERPIEPAPADARPVCSPRAAALLDQVLAMTHTPAKQQLAADWLAGANAAGQRVPHATIPTLLEYGTLTRAVRDAIATVVDARGQWLMGQNKRWQFASGEDADVETVWSTGNREQRASALRRRREADPAAARLLVESTWSEDGADERTAFVEALETKLSPDDEPFLEKALDDRSKQVRAAAIELLSRLPASAFVERMVARVTPLLTFKAGEPGKLLRKAKLATLDIKLPADAYDAAWTRDGIAEKPTGRVGRRQWWLQQMVAAVPPARWSTLWSATPAECIAALSGDFADLIRDAWTTAAARTRDAAWIGALVDRLAETKAEPSAELLAATSVELPPGVLARLIASPKVEESALAAILQNARAPLDDDAARATLAKVEAHAIKQKHYDYALAAVLDQAALRLPPDVALDAAAKWTGDRWEANRRPLDSFLQTLGMRRDIRREFTR